MKILDKFSGFYRESVFDRNKRNLQFSISKNETSSEEKSSSDGLNEATVYLSRQKSDTKVNGIEEAYKLLNEMTRYLNSANQEVNVVEITHNMQFNPKRIASILIS